MLKKTIYLLLTITILVAPKSSCLAQSSSELVAKAIEARESGDFEAAFRMYKQAADKHGNAVAINAVGVMYMEGMGVPQSDKQAFFWIKKAAERGYPPAQKNFGVLYAKGVWVKPNETKAREWLQRAADNGEKEAQNWLSGGDSPSAVADRVINAGSKQANSNEFHSVKTDIEPWGFSPFSHRFICMVLHGHVVSSAARTSQLVGELFLNSALYFRSEADLLAEEKERLNFLQLAQRQAEMEVSGEIMLKKISTLDGNQALWEGLASEDCKAVGIPTPIELNGLTERDVLKLLNGS